MEGTFDPAEGQEGRIQRTILLWMRTFHPKEGLVHMEEGWMLVEEELFHPEVPSFLLWMAMMLPKEGPFLSGERLFLPKNGSLLFEERAMLIFQPPFLRVQPSVLVCEPPFLPDVGLPLHEEGMLLSVNRRGSLRQGATFSKSGKLADGVRQRSLMLTLTHVELESRYRSRLEKIAIQAC